MGEKTLSASELLNNAHAEHLAMALFMAISDSDLYSVMAMLREDTTGIINCQDSNGNTPLMAAALQFISCKERLQQAESSVLHRFRKGKAESVLNFIIGKKDSLNLDIKNQEGQSTADILKDCLEYVPQIDEIINKRFLLELPAFDYMQ